MPPSTTHASMNSPRLTRHLYLKQNHNGKVISGGDRIVVDESSSPIKPITEEFNQTNKSFAESILPFLKEHQIEDTWTGIMPFTKDGNPLIGKISHLPGEVYIITGLASAGMMNGPGSGELLAGLMTGDEKSIKLLETANPDRLIKPI